MLLIIPMTVCFLQAMAAELNGAESCDTPTSDWTFGGNNHGGVFGMMGAETRPAIFSCAYDGGGAKQLRFTITKDTNLIHKGDSITALLLSGVKCEPGSLPNPKMADSNSVVCTLKTEDVSCAEQGIKVSGAIADPTETKICMVLFCENKSTTCTAVADVEFYDQFGIPVPPNYVFSWMDGEEQVGITFGDICVIMVFLGQCLFICCKCWSIKRRYAVLDEDEESM